jgi:hypothetical protein
MPRADWLLRNGRPCIEVTLTLAANGQSLSRTLLADTGAGADNAPFELILDEDDCLLCGGNPDRAVTLGGAYRGSFPTYVIAVRIPALGFATNVRVVGLPSVLTGFDGIACFNFLNRFTYGNCGNMNQFTLEF